MRSLLFVPGDSPRKFAKAIGTAANALVLDLEDSVAASAKAEARETVAEMLRSERAGKILVVRVNAFDTGSTLDDLAAVMPHAPDAVMLPKCRGGHDLDVLDHYLSAFEVANGRERGTVGVIAVATETGESVLGLSTYRPHPRLRGLLWGAEDLTASINATGNRDGEVYSGPFLLARNLCLMAASAAGVAAIDTVCTNLGDLDYVAAEARAARRDGFSAKAVIHPSHVDPVNAAFQPTEAEIAWARSVVRAFEDNPDQGVVQIDGKMIDKPHERAARNILATAGE
ncbi:CoA ester lyase [Aquamicrobium sp. LC103]|uniref:HpcH/HpaI aldolase/citrate lyase family protein n=1 Tax=Aquamicrobium sp. LC103 TaxID=1120658 RepID=UPI00063E9A94|nr:CoA ester lyase [Aquamicrobium sp. LC103]TKT74797.1 CoA ester lyase [Aquamicrobium sp. LC103]